jgi:hypothetical protein
MDSCDFRPSSQCILARVRPSCFPLSEDMGQRSKCVEGKCNFVLVFNQTIHHEDE